MSTSTSVAVVLVEDLMKTEAIATPPNLRLFAAWCHEANLSLFSVRRSHIELVRSVDGGDRAHAPTVARRLSTLASFYRYCEQKQLVDRQPRPQRPSAQGGLRISHPGP